LLDKLDTLAWELYQNTEKYMGLNNCSFQVFRNANLKHSVEVAGPLVHTQEYSFERYIRVMGNMVTGTRHVEKQIGIRDFT
jgi:hypothetical protein